jgi:hypothetical protein
VRLPIKLRFGVSTDWRFAPGQGCAGALREEIVGRASRKLVCLLGLLLYTPAAVYAGEPFPTHAITLIVPYPAGGGAAMLAAVPAGASPAGGTCPVATVVIPDDGKGDRPGRKLGSTRPRRLGNPPGQIRQGG